MQRVRGGAPGNTESIFILTDVCSLCAALFQIATGTSCLSRLDGSIVATESVGLAVH